MLHMGETVNCFWGLSYPMLWTLVALDAAHLHVLVRLRLFGCMSYLHVLSRVSIPLVTISIVIEVYYDVFTLSSYVPLR